MSRAAPAVASSSQRRQSPERLQLRHHWHTEDECYRCWMFKMYISFTLFEKQTKKHNKKKQTNTADFIATKWADAELWWYCVTNTEYLSLSIDTSWVSPFPVRALSSAYLMATTSALPIVALSPHYLRPSFLLVCSSWHVWSSSAPFPLLSAPFLPHSLISGPFLPYL